MSASLPQPILARLDSLRGALRRWLWIVGLSRLCAAAVALALVSFAVDRYFRMDQAQRALCLATALGILGFLAWRHLFRGIRHSPGADELSWDVELRHPELGQSLISAVQLASSAPAGTSVSLVQAAIAEGARRIQRVNVKDVLNASRRNRAMWMALGALAVLVGLGAAFPETAGLWFRRNMLLRNDAWPQVTHLVVLNARDGEIWLPRGDDLDLRVEVRKGDVVPSMVSVDFKAKNAASGSEQLVREGDRFRWSYRNVLEPMQIRVSGGDDSGQWIPVRLAERPAVREIKFTVQPPAYTGLPRADLPLGEGSYFILCGSSMVVSGSASKPLAGMSVALGQNKAPAKLLVSGTTFQIELAPSQMQNGTYAITLSDRDGLSSKPPTRFSIKVQDDARPTVRAKLEGIGDMITPQASIPLSFRVNDDFGISAVALVAQKPTTARSDESADAAGAALQRTPLAMADMKKSADGKQLSHAWRLEVEPLKAPIDSHLAFFVEAKDNDTLNGPKLGMSSTFSLRVVTDEVLRNELLRREQEQRQEFERCVEHQRSLLADSIDVQKMATTQPAWAQSEHRRLKDGEKRQRLLGQRCEAIAAQFAQILAEVENNKLEDTGGAVHKRLQDGIIVPLRTLASTLFPQSADYLDQAATASLPPATRIEALAKAQKLQEQILARMRDVLKNMIKWEGYQEAVLMIRELLKDQQDISEATRKKQEELIKKIFGN
jgi:hypothetical protein